MKKRELDKQLKRLERAQEDNPNFDVELIECPVCVGSAVRLGILGKTIWYQCENCGIEFGRSVDE